LAQLLSQVAHPICTWYTKAELFIGRPEPCIGTCTEKIGFWPKARTPRFRDPSSYKTVRSLPERSFPRLSYKSQFLTDSQFRRFTFLLSPQIVHFERGSVVHPIQKRYKVGKPRTCCHLSPLTLISLDNATIRQRKSHYSSSPRGETPCPSFTD
jgi:hypothetical protein